MFALGDLWSAFQELIAIVIGSLSARLVVDSRIESHYKEAIQATLISNLIARTEPV